MLYYKIKNQLLRDVDAVILDDAEVTVDDGWYADDGNAEVHYPYATSANDAAREYVEDGWGEEDRDKTEWIDVYTCRKGTVEDEDGEEVELEWGREWHTIELDPKDPNEDCDHDWCSPHSVVGGIEENPGVWGHGGGVIIREVCRHCGIYRITDTWAQNPQTGEQGLRSVEYEPADEVSEEWTTNPNS